MDSVTHWVTNNILLTASGGVFLLFVISRFINNDRLDSWGYRIGCIITVGGNVRFKGLYDKVEKAVINWGGTFFKGLLRGLLSDNNGGNNVKK